MKVAGWKCFKLNSPDSDAVQQSKIRVPLNCKVLSAQHSRSDTRSAVTGSLRFRISPSSAQGGGHKNVLPIPVEVSGRKRLESGIWLRLVKYSLSGSIRSVEKLIFRSKGVSRLFREDAKRTKVESPALLPEQTPVWFRLTLPVVKATRLLLFNYWREFWVQWNLKEHPPIIHSFDSEKKLQV